MKSSEHRIFISDLPEAATDKEIKSLFSSYGKVNSVEIKTRKELTPKNKSYFFAYVNLDTDHHNLNKCFQDFQNEPWHGNYIKLQIAKESFLDRLKREREEAQKKGNKDESHTLDDLPNINPVVNIPPPKTPKFDYENITSERPKKRKISEETNSDADNEITLDNKLLKKKQKSFALEDKTTSDDTDKIKNNQDDKLVPKIHKSTSNKFLTKIPSCGNAPIVVFNTKKEQSKNLSAANLKRLESLKNLKKGYQNEKDLIKSALQNIDAQPKSKKIIFDDDGLENNLNKPAVNGFHKTKNDLFNEEDDDEFEGNFQIEEHLEGEKGKKLLELQSKFRNDKRFALDKRFLDDGNEPLENFNENENDEEESLETEKNKEINILEQVLGKKISKPTTKKSEKTGPSKAMLRFDPTLGNSNFELEHVVEEPKKKKTKKELKEEAERAQNSVKPEVSKEVFYKVSDNLKDTFEESQGFSLLSTFGRTENDKDNPDQFDNENADNTSVPKQKLSNNPFKYDSSDDEDETADIPHTNDTLKLDNSQQQPKPTSSRAVFWTESFFFKPDDHRLQDGFDFIEKMKMPDDKEFSAVRQGLKGVIRTKVRNSERKNRMFKKKLGGSKSGRRKHIRIRKALKR